MSTAHWDTVYREKPADGVSWYQPSPAASLRAFDAADVPPAAAVVDVGGGASALVDALLARGFTDITVLDIAAEALNVSKTRLGAAAGQVQWQVADVTAWAPPRAYDVWHDRAAFHFLLSAAERDAYRRALHGGTRTGSVVILATFAPDGPERCSNLPVARYDAAGLAAELGPSFHLLEQWREQHTTPWGSGQSFQWGVFRRV